MCRMWGLRVLLVGISLSAFGQVDTSKPEVRKMILEERRRLDCKGIYQQTRLKLDAQLKLANKVEASAGLGAQTLANLNDTAVALGQKRREFCELYKVTPELSKDDYFRVYGELDKRESDLDLIFRSVTSKDPADSLKNLKTIAPRETNAPGDISSALTDLRQAVADMDLRMTTIEKKLTTVEQAQRQIASEVERDAPRHITSGQRQAMLPILTRLRGLPVAVACKLLDGESCDYGDEISALFRDAGCAVPGMIKSSLNDFRGYIVIAKHGDADPRIIQIVSDAFEAGGVLVRVEAVSEGSLGMWYPDTVHVIVGRKAP